MSSVRPERSIVKKALVDAGGSKVKAAALLGCTRQSLYTWIYQYGLERLAGVRMDTRPEVDTDARPYAGPGKERKSAVYSGVDASPTLRLVEQVASPDFPVQATFKVRDSLWKQMKIEAIRRGCTVAALAETAFERVLTEADPKKLKGGGK